MTRYYPNLVEHGTPAYNKHCEENKDVWFCTREEYSLADPCPTCKAVPGLDCDAPGKASSTDRGHRQHSTRQDRGIAHYNRDVGRAPWPEQRLPGVCYSSIPEGVLAHIRRTG